MIEYFNIRLVDDEVNADRSITLGGGKDLQHGLFQGQALLGGYIHQHAPFVVTKSRT